MTPFISCPQWAQGIFGIWTFILFTWSCTFLIIKFGVKRKVPKELRNLLLFLLTLINYTLYQLGVAFHTNINTDFKHFVDIFGRVPYVLAMALCVLGTALLFFWTKYSHEWNGKHVSDAAIKEAVDTLPAGICIYEETGRINLKNATMELIYNLMTGGDLLNGRELERVIRSAPAVTSNREKIVISLPDGTTRSFVQKKLSGSDHLIAIEAFDVTEEYDKTLLLQEKRTALNRLNEELVSYNNNIIVAITAQEILNAKVKIHDEMGESLLAIRHYLTAEDTEEEKEIILGKLERNISFLLRETEVPSKDEYELMINTAAALGVKVTVEGELPETQPVKHIVATGIHECFTNTLRHAHGDELRLKLTREGSSLKAEFSNNGDAPSGEVDEKGGLSFLRSLVENNGGTMEIVSMPEFVLKITVAMEEDDDL